MKTARLEAATLHQVADGDLASKLDDELYRVIKDCLERHRDDRKRSVTLKLVFQPDGKHVIVNFEVSSRMPSREGTLFAAKPDPDQGVLFFDFDEDEVSI